VLSAVDTTSVSSATINEAIDAKASTQPLADPEVRPPPLLPVQVMLSSDYERPWRGCRRTPQ
jgi:hypothetical protein